MASFRIGHKVTLCGVALMVAIAGRTSAQTPAPDYRAADSIVLERGPCFGNCPVYRVSIARSGDVRFRRRDSADSAMKRLHIDPKRFSDLMFLVFEADFVALPDTLTGSFCGSRFTDASSADVALFLPNREKKIHDYHGCPWAPFILREIETTIDEYAGTRRWLH